MAVWSEGRPAWWAKLPPRPGRELVFVGCQWCNTRRGVLPSGVLLCPCCDYAAGDGGPWVGDIVRDAPLDWL